MYEQLTNAPIGFWLALLIFAVLVIEGLRNWHQAWAKPALAIYGTIGVWYLGDYLATDPGVYERFAPDMVEVSFLQVAAFLIITRLLYPKFVRRFCRGLNPPRIGATVVGNRMTPHATTTVNKNLISPVSQTTLFRILLALIALWTFLFIFAVYLRDGQWLPLLWPPIQRQKIGMFSHSGLGTNTSFMVATAGYIHLLVSALFALAALLGRGHVRWLAMAMVCLSWPYFLFDRTRNAMLALFLPAVGGYWSFGRQQIVIKIAVSMLLFAGVDTWFRQVMVYRSGGRDLRAFTETTRSKEIRHHGLDLMKELCWINTFIGNGRYKVNWGHRYFAEAVNFIPRALWSDKPKIGWDYSAARGFMGYGDRMPTATISTGMIGQGLVNFGPYFGVLAAATLMAMWIALLSRLWLQRASLLRKLLFLMGLGLTFNMGRDITLLVLFPFVFGYIGVRFVELAAPRRKRKRPRFGSLDTQLRRQVSVP